MLWIFSLVQWRCWTAYTEREVLIVRNIVCRDASRVAWEVQYNASNRLFVAELSPLHARLTNMTELEEKFPIGRWVRAYAPKEPLLSEDALACTKAPCHVVYLDKETFLFFRAAVLGVWTALLAVFACTTVFQFFVGRWVWRAYRPRFGVSSEARRGR